MWTRAVPCIRTRSSSFVPALTLLLSLANSLTIQHLPRELIERAEPDPFTPHDGPFIWYALGDSYTAGPGAGDLDPSNKDDCVRSKGSYAPQLQSDWLYTGENQLNFLACTGAVTDTVLSDQLPEISSDPPPDFVVMTLGGNDIGFSKIAKACLVGLVGAGNCDDKIADARKVVDNMNDPFWAKLDKTYDGIFDQMPKDMHYQMFHLGYSKFFNVDATSTWCNDQTLGKIGFSGLNPPKLTFDLRNKLNKLTEDWNSSLYAHLLGYVQHRLNKGTAPDGWQFTRLWFAHYDKSDTYSFEDHRFCVPGVEDSKFQDPSTWFFGVWGDQKDAEVSADHFANINAASCASDPKYDSDDAFAWDCDMAVYYADPTTDHSVTTIPGADFTRSFHPKTSGFEMVKNYLVANIKKVRRVPPINQCIPAPGPDLENLASLASGYPTSLCATASGAIVTALGAPATTTDTPSPTTAAPSPTGTCKSKCNCNEDGCTADSPGCCGNGTCDQNC